MVTGRENDIQLIDGFSIYRPQELCKRRFLESGIPQKEKKEKKMFLIN